MLTPYPTEFPREALNLMLDAIRGQIPETQLIVHAAWDVAGFALGKTIGGGPIISGDNVDASDEDILLMALAHDAPAGVSESLFPWALVLAIAIKLIGKYAV